jgi:hypothetical protein
MAVKTWQPMRIYFCHHVQQEVTLEAELVYPAEWMPYQLPRILARRCSNGLACNLDDRASCAWSGTNPAFDPFAEM